MMDTNFVAYKMKSSCQFLLSKKGRKVSEECVLKDALYKVIEELYKC
jgi:hypothetical protein